MGLISIWTPEAGEVSNQHFAKMAKPKPTGDGGTAGAKGAETAGWDVPPRWWGADWEGESREQLMPERKVKNKKKSISAPFIPHPARATGSISEPGDWGALEIHCRRIL